MSNFLAIASVTTTLVYILEEVNRFVPGIKITTKPLDAVDLQHPVNGLNVFLYRIELSSALGSIDLPVRDSSGALENNPVLALDLHFLITPYASENDEIVSQQILASAMNVLNNSPVLAGRQIREAIRGREGLESSDLAEQVESIKLSMDRLTFEEMSRIWSRFPNANYRPSVSYTAATVILESALPRRLIPAVRRISTDADQLVVPYVERVEPSNIEYSKDAKVTIFGRNLKSENVVVRFGEKGDSWGRPIQHEGDAAGNNNIAVSDRRIEVGLPPNLSPGIVKVRVEHHFLPSGEGAASKIKGMPQRQQQQQQQQEKYRNNPKIVTSNGSPFVLAPRIISPSAEKITVISAGKELAIEFEPGISLDQQNGASIMIGDNEIPLQRSSDSQVDDKKQSQKGEYDPIRNIRNLVFTIPQNIRPGTYLLRLRIAEGESMPAVDENPRSPTYMQYIGPMVKVV